jgi:hypothetical protein
MTCTVSGISRKRASPEFVLSPHLRGLVAEHVTRGILAIDADVPFRAAAEFAVGADVARLHLHRELRIEVARLADAFPAHDVRHLEICSVRSACRYAVISSTTIALAGIVMSSQSFTDAAERLLAQHVQASRRWRTGPHSACSCWAVARTPHSMAPLSNNLSHR